MAIRSGSPPPSKFRRIFEMKRTIAGLLCAALVGTAGFAQEVTFFNRFGSQLVTQDASENASADFGHLYNRVQGSYDSEKFSLWGRAQMRLYSINNKWDENVRVGLDPDHLMFSGAFRPLEFLELIVGKGAGDEGLWGAAYLPGAYGYGTDASYGVRKWASGEGFTVAFKGAGVGMEGLTIGWNALTEEDTLSQKKADGSQDKSEGWETGLGVSYIIPDLVGIGFGGRFNTAENANQELGIYAELLAVENLQASVGVSMDTNATVYEIEKKNIDKVSVTAADNNWGQTSLLQERDFRAFVNAGVQYNFGGMGLPLAVGADVGLLAGAVEVWKLGNESVSVMPMIVGALVGFVPNEQFWADLRVTYADSLASGSETIKHYGQRSNLTVTPRAHFILNGTDEFRLQVPISTNFWKQNKDTSKNATGFKVEVWWQHNF